VVKMAGGAGQGGAARGKGGQRMAVAQRVAVVMWQCVIWSGCVIAVILSGGKLEIGAIWRVAVGYWVVLVGLAERARGVQHDVGWQWQ
jgi:hypothetical protein